MLDSLQQDINNGVILYNSFTSKNITCTLDKFIKRVEEVAEECYTSLEKYDYYTAKFVAESFFKFTFCDVYIELVNKILF